MNNKYRFVKKWDEDTDITWWKESRIELNKIIDAYNKWQIDDDFDVDKSKRVIALIEFGKQTIGSIDGGSGYLEELEKMEEFIKQSLRY